jgi:hypothetical protein
MMTLIFTICASAAVVVWLCAYVRKNRVRWMKRDIDEGRGASARDGYSKDDLSAFDPVRMRMRAEAFALERDAAEAAALKS